MIKLTKCTAHTRKKGNVCICIKSKESQRSSSRKFAWRRLLQWHETVKRPVWHAMAQPGVADQLTWVIDWVCLGAAAQTCSVDLSILRLYKQTKFEMNQKTGLLPEGSGWNGWRVKKTQSNIHPLPAADEQQRSHSPSCDPAKTATKSCFTVSRCRLWSTLISRLKKVWCHHSFNFAVKLKISVHFYPHIIRSMFLILWQKRQIKLRRHESSTNNLNFNVFVVVFLIKMYKILSHERFKVI